MDADLRVPVGPEAEQWVTVRAERTVLAVARTLTSTLRVLEAVATFAGDPRVQVVFAINASTPFGDGVDRLLRDVGARVLPWRQVRHVRFDAVLTASENTELDGVDAPVLVLPHGIGFHKLLPDSRGSGRRLSGSVRAADANCGHVLVAVSHPDQAEQLRAHSPHLAGRTVVVTDPVYERMRASVWFRDRYRRALGTGHRRLVVLSSTWGQQSLLGRWPDLPSRLLGELPADEYQVVAALHPNVWSGHGAWQIRSWLAHARDGGLFTVPPEGSWSAVLVAADAVVADHGSLSVYAAAVDRPLLLAPFGDEVVPGTALSTLASAAPTLEPERSLLDQVASAIVTHRSDRYRDAVAQSFATTARPLREVLYKLVALPEPADEPPTHGLPEPRVEGAPATSYALYTQRPSADAIRVRRIPAAVDMPAPAAAGWSRSLAVYEREWNLRMVHGASLLVRPEPSTVEAGVAWARATLKRLPGATAAAAKTDEGCVVKLRDGPLVVAVPDGHCDAMLQASAVTALWHAGELVDHSVTLLVGAAPPSRIEIRLLTNP